MKTKLNRDVVYEKLLSAIAEVLVIKKSEIALESRYMEDLGATSLDMASMLILLDEDFGVKISEAEGMKLKTVQDTLDFILRKCCSEAR